MTCRQGAWPPLPAAAVGPEDSIGSLNSGHKISGRSLGAPPTSPEMDAGTARRKHKDMFQSIYMGKAAVTTRKRNSVRKNTSPKKKDEAERKEAEKGEKGEKGEQQATPKQVPAAPVEYFPTSPSFW